MEIESFQPPDMAKIETAEDWLQQRVSVGVRASGAYRSVSVRFTSRTPETVALEQIDHHGGDWVAVGIQERTVNSGRRLRGNNWTTSRRFDSKLDR